MLKRNNMIAVMCLALVLCLAGAAAAQQAKGKRAAADDAGMPAFCPLNLNLTPEQSTKIQDLRTALFKDTISLRADIFKKEQELDALMLEATVDAEKAKKLQDEISGLKAQMAQKTLQAQLEARKVLTPEQVKQLPPGCNMGFGPGPGGMGCGMGMGSWGGKGAGMGKGCGMGKGPGRGQNAW